jgi:hypothetical protein
VSPTYVPARGERSISALVKVRTHEQTGTCGAEAELLVAGAVIVARKVASDGCEQKRDTTSL